MSPASYQGPEEGLDVSWQYFHERPAAQNDSGETVYATDPEPPGEEHTENVPVPDCGDREEPDRTGQSTLDDFAGGSA